VSVVEVEILFLVYSRLRLVPLMYEYQAIERIPNHTSMNQSEAQRKKKDLDGALSPSTSHPSCHAFLDKVSFLSPHTVSWILQTPRLLRIHLYFVTAEFLDSRIGWSTSIQLIRGARFATFHFLRCCNGCISTESFRHINLIASTQ